jgi:hypothetical protein
MSKAGQIALAMFLAAMAVAAFFAALLVSVPSARAHECAFPLEKTALGFVAKGGTMHGLVNVANGNWYDQIILLSAKGVVFVGFVDRGCIVSSPAPSAWLRRRVPDA